MWQGKQEWIPNGEAAWCEIWISSNSLEAEASVRRISQQFNISLQQETLNFPERKVILAKANRNMLIELMESGPYIAEFRRAAETALFLLIWKIVNKLNGLKN